jgi:hypothetical protein
MLVEDLARLMTLIQIREAVARSSTVVFAEEVVALDNDKMEAPGALAAGRKAAIEHINVELRAVVERVSASLAKLE